ncbi:MULTISPECIES: uroporphyrinogen-III C-methyltransferase [Dermacoccus]|uniref:uroporphyrinogen-III C-methyltransferase n=1 Tax=Dermacoccus TaxID=57495 RepID=UPI000A7A434D|nr:uroporphyrinogen-III C-methyltransferase [Dermacoccus nishinomiyaensis]
MTSSDDACGRVVLVGGGPGALDLLTIRALRELRAADVIVADRLGPRDELDQLGLDAEIIDVGKTPHHHPVPQVEINKILVREARAGRRVVRLKGGDPYLLGRGGEELLHCRAHGVEVDVVPGVTSALSAPLAGGIPVTHRGVSAGMLVLSGHDDLALDSLAVWPHTIVVLMGMSRLPTLAAGLVGHGKDAATPAGVVYRAWTPQQRVIKGTLATIAAQCAVEEVGNPSVIIIGDVVDVLHDAEIVQVARDADSAQGNASGQRDLDVPA